MYTNTIVALKLKFMSSLLLCLHFFKYAFFNLHSLLKFKIHYKDPTLHNFGFKRCLNHCLSC